MQRLDQTDADLVAKDSSSRVVSDRQYHNKPQVKSSPQQQKESQVQSQWIMGGKQHQQLEAEYGTVRPSVCFLIPSIHRPELTRTT